MPHLATHHPFIDDCPILSPSLAKERASPKATAGTAGGRKKGEPWTKRQTRQRCDALLPIPLRPSRPLRPQGHQLGRLVERVEGRDKLSCMNKWQLDVMPKLQAFIDSLGE
ncbi:hypothetical protein Q5752_006518 [Cryptotrichosporon argae]